MNTNKYVSSKKQINTRCYLGEELKSELRGAEPLVLASTDVSSQQHNEDDENNNNKAFVAVVKLLVHSRFAGRKGLCCSGKVSE
jgi:hypothetical protein